MAEWWGSTPRTPCRSPGLNGVPACGIRVPKPSHATNVVSIYKKICKSEEQIKTPPPILSVFVEKNIRNLKQVIFHEIDAFDLEIKPKLEKVLSSTYAFCTSNALCINFSIK